MPQHGEVQKLNIEECIAVYDADAELWTVYTDAEQVGYLGDCDDIEQCKRVAREFYDNLKNG